MALVQGTQRMVVPGPDPLEQAAVTTYDALGCRGVARVDFFLTAEGPVLNEVNTMPGFTDTSVYAKLFDATGVAYAELCDRLVGLAVERHTRERAYEF